VAPRVPTEKLSRKRTVLVSRGAVVPPEVRRTMGRVGDCVWMNVVAWAVEVEREVGAGLVVKYVSEGEAIVERDAVCGGDFD